MGVIGTLILTTAIAGIGGTGLGGLIGALLQKDSNRTVSLLLSFAGGVMLSVVCFDLVVEALETNVGVMTVIASIATGVAAYPLLSEIANLCEQKFDGLKCNVYAINNDFFGEKITVAGLITATDIYNQLKDRDLGDTLLIPSSMLRAEGDMFLDSVTVEELSKKLNVKNSDTNTNFILLSPYL